MKSNTMRQSFGWLRYRTQASIACLILGCFILYFSGCDSPPEKISGSSNSQSLRLERGNSTDSNHLTADGKKILRVPLASAGPRTLDPALGSTLDDGRCISQIYETLLQYQYLVRPLELEPLLLKGMPTISDDGLTYRFQLKRGIRFHNDECFPGVSGRELVCDDVFYSWKRLADPAISPSKKWPLRGLIVGLDGARQRAETNGSFDFDGEIEGLKKVSDHEFTVTLTAPTPRFQWTLAMYQLSIVPREAVEKYGPKFASHPVGTGPFMVQEDDWENGESLTMNRHPHYHEQYYPVEHMPDDVVAGRAEAAGQKLPLIDRIETIFYNQTTPMWRDFRSRKIGFTTIPATVLDEAFMGQTKTLKASFAKEGITDQRITLLDFIFIGFNMEDEMVGGSSDEKKNLRRAIACAIDWEARNSQFYHDLGVIYDGMIPPGLTGHPPAGKLVNFARGLDVEQAKKLLVSAGYAGGKNLPAIEYHSVDQDPGVQMAKLTAENLSNIGVRVNVRLDDFSNFMETIDAKKAPMFAFGWSADYPDAENILALFYGPNESPGNNHFNYHNAEFDRLYEKLVTLKPGKDRSKLIEEMRDMVVADCPFAGSLARIRPYLVNPELKNFKASEAFHNWYKYLDVGSATSNR